MKNNSYLRQEECPVLPAIGECYSCGLCEHVCSHHAIKIRQDRLGFFRPVVDTDACVLCRACERACEKLHRAKPRKGIQECYEAWNLDEAERMDSSSGGVFMVLARHCLRQGGVVVGVAWKSRDSAVYTAVENEGDLLKLRKSKYTQADPEDVISKIRDYLQQGRKVLFSGLPCHARVIRLRFGDKVDNLLIVDIACYGVPSCNLLKAFIRSMEEEHGEVSSYDCRYKGAGWRSYSACVHYKDGEKEILPSVDNMFQNTFICTGLVYNDSCYTCSLDAGDRFSDISMGDYWGRRVSDEGDRLGVSSVICLTSKGNAVLNSLAKTGELHLSPISMEDLLRGNGGFSKPPRSEPLARREFLTALAGEPLHRVNKRFVNRYNSPLPCFHVGKRLVIVPRYVEALWLLPRMYAGRIRRWIVGCLRKLKGDR